MYKTHLIHGVGEMRELANKLLHAGYQHFALTGDLGSGKTTFVQQAAKVLGLTANMPSPTFTLLSIYQLSLFPVYHFDLYRLRDEEEALDAGLEEYWDQRNAYVFIEWPEIVASHLPDNYLWLSLSYKNENTRQVWLKNLDFAE